MSKKRKNKSPRIGLQLVTLVISTAMVLVLLGLVVMSTLTARNLSAMVRENLVVTLMLDQDMTRPEAAKMSERLAKRPYIRHVTYISKEQALAEGKRDLGVDPTEFADGNPFLSSMDVTLKADYVSPDSLSWITRELQALPKVNRIDYQKDLIDKVNHMIAKIGIVLLTLAVLLTFISFALINNTVRLSIYARRFSIHTMKLVGASWGFIRRPFVVQALVVGLVSALLAVGALAAILAWSYRQEPDILSVITPQVQVITAVAVFGFGVIITGICSYISVGRFLKMKAGELYRI